MHTPVNAIDSSTQKSASEKQVGENLAQARRLAGFEAIDEVSKLTQLPKETIEIIERGCVDRYLREIYDLICLYSCPTHHVFKGYFDLSEIEHNQSSDIKACQAYVVDVIGFHKKIHGKEIRLNKTPFNRGEKQKTRTSIIKTNNSRSILNKKISASTLKRRADTLRHEHSLYQLPINVYQIALDLGIIISFESFPNDFYMKLKGFCYKDEDISIIGLNKNHPTVLQRFTLGHELHHYLYDFKTKSYLCGPENESIALEWNAEKFAAELLMPSEYVRKLVSTPLNIRYLTITLVAKHFGVSYEAAAVRLVNFGLISDLKSACGSAYKRKDRKKTRYLLDTQLEHLSAVFGLETGIEELQSNSKLVHKHVCGAYINDINQTVCWRCGLEFQNITQGSYWNNPFRQSSFNVSPNTVSSLEEYKEHYKQLSLNLNANR
ncbi:MAG: ImmA/IrrE family metallo-endopeptidase [Leptolyngbyaceae cyanobacterium]